MAELSLVSYTPSDAPMNTAPAIPAPAPSPAPDASAGSPAPILNLLDSTADNYGVPRQLMRTVAQMESSFNPMADSGKAQGLMQLAPKTAKWLGVTQPFDPVQSANGGAKLLANLIDKYNGDTRLVLAAYNAGEGAVDKYGDVPPYDETQKYVAKGMKSLPGKVSLGAQPAPASSQTPTPAEGDYGQNLLTRLAAGEDIDVTPQMLAQLMNPPIHALEPSPIQPKPATPLSLVSYEPTPGGPGSSAAEPSPLSKYGTAVWQGIGGPQMVDLAKTAITDPTAADAKKRVFMAGLGHMLANEPARILPQAIESYTSLPNLGSSLYHALGTIPVIGGPLQNAMDEIGRGAYAEGFGHGTAIAAPFFAGPAAEAVGEVAGPALEATGTALKGGVGGALKEATTMVPLKKFGIGISVPKPIVTGVAGGEAGGLVGIPHPVGAVVGAAAPLVGGFVRGARQALAERAAAAAPEAAAEAVPEAAAASPAAAAAPEAPPQTGIPGYPEVTLENVARGINLKKPIKDWSDEERATVQTVYDRLVQELSEKTPPQQPRWKSPYAPTPPAETATPVAAAAPEAPPVTPQELTQDVTGKPPSKQSAAAQASAAETLATAQEPVAPVAPVEAAATEVPVSRAAQASKLMADLEGVTRPERMTDFVRRIAADIAPADLEKFSPDEWKMIARGAGSPEGTVPTPQDIQQIRTNLAQAPKPALGGEPAMEPAAAPSPVTPPPGILKPADVAGMSPAEALAALYPEFRTPPSETAATTALTASAARVEAIAQELAKGTIPTSELARIERTPNAVLLLETLSRKLGHARPAPGEIPKIVERVRQLRGEPPATRAAAAAKP